jgi:hypothetical protein
MSCVDVGACFFLVLSRGDALSQLSLILNGAEGALEEISYTYKKCV